MAEKELNIDSIATAATEKMAKAAGFKPAAQPVQIVESEVVNTGPIDFAAMKAATKPLEIIKSDPKQPTGFLSVSGDDAKYGKAFQVAIKTHKKFKVGTVSDFISLIEEIKNNL